MEPGNYPSERKFLHDIASPLGTALFSVQIIAGSLEGKPGIEPEDLEQLAHLNAALEKIKELLTNRRDFLIKNGL